MRKLCRFAVEDGEPHLGLLVEDGLLDLTAYDPRRFARLSVLLRQPDWREQLEVAAERCPYRLPAPPHPAAGGGEPAGGGGALRLLRPTDDQEVWAAGLTYKLSEEARVRESQKDSDVYMRAYAAVRPELFFKATPHRCVGSGEPIRLRPDAAWNVPEPELAVLLTPSLEVVGYTIGNDVSSRDIEGENPLYLPQAKIWVGSCAIGPAVALAADVPDPLALVIRMTIRRGGSPCFQGEIELGRMNRPIGELVEYLGRANGFPDGVVLLTGTGIVPEDSFTLQPGDVVEVEVPGIGTLVNALTVAA